MNDKYFSFKRFCYLLSEEKILEKATAPVVMEDFRLCIVEIKSDVLLKLVDLGESKNDYLDYLINEIKKQNYIKNIDVSRVQKWLDEYDINIEDIFNTNYNNKGFDQLFDVHYSHMELYTPETNKVYAIQNDFLYFFCSHYADELISFLNSRKTSIKTIIKQDEKPQKNVIKQMTTNQVVILLDRLGVFTTAELENTPNTKKAKLISNLIGRNEKNIKSAIENLDKKPSNLGEGYQRDIEMVDQLLSSL